MIELTADQLAFVTERHMATLTTLRSDGTPHVVPVAFTWDSERGIARINTQRTSVKARNIGRHQNSAGSARVALCQVDGGRWLTLEGTATVVEDPAEVAESMRRYAERFRVLQPKPERVVIVVSPDRVLPAPR
ncbi:MAG: pyridoxamine 5'-phosphate oxidase family protein [Nocardioides sp.]